MLVFHIYCFGKVLLFIVLGIIGIIVYVITADYFIILLTFIFSQALGLDCSYYIVLMSFNHLGCFYTAINSNLYCFLP